MLRSGASGPLHPLDQFSDGARVFACLGLKLKRGRFRVGVYRERATARGSDRVADKGVCLRENDFVLVVQRERDRVGIVGEPRVADAEEIPIGAPNDLVAVMNKFDIGSGGVHEALHRRRRRPTDFILDPDLDPIVLLVDRVDDGPRRDLADLFCVGARGGTERDVRPCRLRAYLRTSEL
jgi:hypothetical protein